ncbi:hypothetical protein BWQ96_07541 [Gracilariopsis chorda]|uniref:Uncharacterized protein n=1 Tax=Gracilariopsis chorda TaxID=448386 RepID=A0A2V3IKW6_9FLOR|nr:hypothetical protein BWQ96_07541 [Gracilariopsis chorda]|eukprot:PXF42726.1 hypothetical protein BWQ96_07541 [Gracilariopsis chorda]
MPGSSSGGPIQVETGSVSISEADVASGKPYNITPIVILRFHLAVHLEHLQAHIYRTAGEKKSRALRLARLIWFGPEYQHERTVAELIVHNRLTPDPHHPITLTPSPPTPAPNAAIDLSAWRTPFSQQPYPKTSVQTPQEYALQQAVQRLNFEEDHPRPPAPHATTMPPHSRMDRNTIDFRSNQKPALFNPPVYPQQNSAVHPNVQTHAPNTSNSSPGHQGQYGQHQNHSNNLWERHSKLAVAFSTASKDASNRYSGNIDDSWPEKREMFEDVAQNYRCSKAEALQFLNNLFTGGARVTFRKLIKGQVQDYDTAMAILEKEFHNAPA